MTTRVRLAKTICLVLVLGCTMLAQNPRGRALGIPFDGTPGPNNAITDVAGISVGHSTLIRGEGKLVPGQGPVRTGVTAILPRPKGNWDFVMAATFNQNGNGDMTGVNWIEESGFLEGPILLTGTHSVGVVRDAAIHWQISHGREFVFTYPIVAETFDSLNDANGQHVKPEHASQALDAAKSGRVEEGAVGGGTGMVCNGFKGGIGTSSRLVTVARKQYTLGVLVQCNYGGDLQVLGVPVGREITDLRACTTLPQTRPWIGSRMRPCTTAKASRRLAAEAVAEMGRGSIVVVVATDAPLLPHQLKRIARRVGMGLGKLGSWAGNGSGGSCLCSLHGQSRSRRSIRNRQTRDDSERRHRSAVPRDDRRNGRGGGKRDAWAFAVMTGVDGIRIFGLPGPRLVEVLKKYGRIR